MAGPVELDSTSALGYGRLAVDSHRGGYVERFAPTVALDRASTCLLLVDFQYAHASRSHGLGRLAGHAGAYRYGRIERTVLPNAVRLLAGFRASGARRAFLRVGSALPDYSDVPPHLREMCMAAGNRLGERETEVLDELRPRRGEPLLSKTTLSGFASGELEPLLRSWGIETVAVCGVTTNMCVEHTVRDAADRGFQALLVEDACATDTPELHVAGLRNVARLYGRVATTASVLEEVSACTTS